MLIPVSVLQSAPNTTVVSPAVAGYVGWWDASITTDMTLFNGIQISALADRSGNTRNISQGTAWFMAAPSVHPVYLNGRQGMLFDGSDDRYSFSPTSLPADDRTETSFFVGIAKSNSIERTILGTLGANGGRQIRINAAGTVSVLSQFVTNLFTTTGTIADGSPFVLAVILDTNSVEVRINSNTPETAVDSTTFTAGRLSVLGENGSNLSERYCGLMGELIVYDTALSGADVTSVMNGLKAKWAIT